MKRTDVKTGKRLSDTVLENLEPEEKEYRVNDGSGLYFVVNPSGRKRWELRYKKPNGKWSFVGLGSYPAVKGKLARSKAAELSNAIGNGDNPVITKQEKKQQELEATNSTFERLAREWLDTKINKWTDGTMKRNKGALELHIFPIMGKRAYKDIKPIEWMNLFKNIQREKGIIEQSNRMRALCQEIYDLAKVTGRIDYNPLEGLHRFLQTAKSENMKHVSSNELPALIRAIQNYPTREVSIGLQLLLMLFPRPSELRTALWKEFDLDEALWTIPAERMKKRKQHIIPLPRQAIELLVELHCLSATSPYLFPSRSNQHQCKSDTVFIMALRRLGYEGRQSPHGFRHIASTTLREKGFKRDTVESALAHAVGGVEGVYNKAAYLEERTAMMQYWADYLNEIANNTGSKVVISKMSEVSLGSFMQHN